MNHIFATVEATMPRALQGPFLSRRRSLYPDGPYCSAVGFGCYRLAQESHLESLNLALDRGVNLVDTSSNYGDGLGEILLGRALHKRPRAEIIVVTKGGYLQGQNLDIARDKQLQGSPFPDVYSFGTHLSHCIHPQWIEHQIQQSRQRMGVQGIDVYLLHNPEYLLKHFEMSKMDIPTARDLFYSKIQDSFEFLEEMVRIGYIGSYGVSSNTLGQPDDDPTSVSLARLLQCASNVTQHHHFKVAQCPLNLIEVGPAFMPITGEHGPSTIDFAQANGLGILVNRPLNAIVNDALVRLAAPDAAAVHRLAADPVMQTWAKTSDDFLRSLRTIEPDQYSAATLSQIAVSLISDLPGVSSVLCGMRCNSYVDDIEAAMRLPKQAKAKDTLWAFYDGLTTQ